MRRLAGITSVVIILVAVGLLLARHGEHPSPQEAQRDTIVSTATPPAAILPGNAPTPAPAPASVAVGDHVPAPQPFSFVRSSTDLTHEQPSACLNFSRPLDARPEIHYGDWVKLTPAPDAQLRVRDMALCIDGLVLARRYQVAIATGLPARDGSRLDTSANTTIEFGDRPKMVNLAGQGFMLSRDDSAGFVVDTVNVDKIAVEVLRINDRLAPGMIRTLRGEEQGYRWNLNKLVESSARALWSGTMEIKGPRNEVVHTAFPLSQITDPGQPGVYLIVAMKTEGLQPRDKEKQFLWQRTDNDEFSTQLVVHTDIAITSVRAADGLHVFTRSLSTAAPLPGVDVELQARDGQVLGKAPSDDTGHSVFAPGLLRGSGAASAHAVVAYGKEDFSLLDITQPAFDLSDRGVAGRDVPGPLDAFVYTDRGIYRPGERIHATSLLRDRIGQAIENGPLTLTLLKPNGVAFKRTVLPPQPAGGFRMDYDLPDTASRGNWRVEASDADGKVIGETTVEVQDFVPQRLKVTARSQATKLHSGDPIEVVIDGRFLYGAPASELGAEAHMNVAVDPAPFPQSAQGFRFGVEDSDFKPQEVDLDAQPSDADGHAVVSGKLEIVPPANVALKATITAGLREPGGRVTSDQLSLPIRADGLMVGIRPRFKDARVREGDAAGFEMIAVDDDGKPQATRLRWTLIERIGHYDWFLSGGRWNFHRTDIEKTIASGDLDATPERPAVLVRKFDWGDYRLVVESPAGTSGSGMAVFGFRSGWMATAGAADTPDKVDVTVEHERYKVGDTARLRIVPPFAGKVRLMVARDKVFGTREVDVPREGATVDVPVTADWGSGAYVLASLYRPADGGKGHLPIRAIGLAWVGVDPGSHLLNVAVKLPAKVTPRQTIELPITVSGGMAGEQVYLSVAAVDEGILQLTRFVTPDPGKFYFGQRRLAVDIRDDYGRLLDGNQGEVGAIRSGGDSMGGKGLPVVPTRSVALFKGPVKVDANGEVSIRVDIPDFEGELRVMAVAFSQTGVGRAEAPLTVRDPVVPDLALPRFLAPGDEGRMTMLLDNRDGQAGDYKVEFNVAGAARLPEAKPWQVALGKGDRKVATFPIAGVSEGTATVTIRLTGPDALAITREWSISVRGAHYPITLESTALQHQNENFKLDTYLVDAFVAGSASVQVSYARLAGMDVPGLLQSLWRYPYGCTEQLASTAFPLVYYTDPLLSSGASDKAGVRHRVQTAIDRIIDRQDPEGTFGLWRAGDGLASNWLSLYALDFLIHAKAAAFDVSDAAIERAYSNADAIFRSTNNDSEDPGGRDAAAYAAWLLAPVHRADLGRLRQLHDGLESRPSLVSWDNRREGIAAAPMALAQVSGALAVLGDRSRGINAMRLAVGAVERPYVAQWWTTYGYWSRLRDAAGILAVGAESDQLPSVQSLVPRLQSLSKSPDRLTTQEKAWLLVAAHAVLAGDKSVGLTVNGKPIEGQDGAAALHPNESDIRAGYTITPTSRDLWRTVVVHGSPKVAPAALANELSLKKAYFAIDGSPLDPSDLPQNRRFIVSLRGASDDSALHRLAVVDLLPAGWEIEAVIRPDQAPDFLGQLTKLRVREARDDRLVIALDLGEAGYWYHDWDTDDNKAGDSEAKSGRFHVAYVVRAVTPGNFTLPEAVVEDMYRPGVMARTAAGRATVRAP